MQLELTTRVLCIIEEDQWCAIALDMSLRGYGDTIEEATVQLWNAIEAQVSFAIMQDNLNEVFVPDEPHYFELFDNLKREAIKRRMQNKTIGLRDMFAGDLLLPTFPIPNGPVFEATAAV